MQLLAVEQVLLAVLLASIVHVTVQDEASEAYIS
jgi:hypothetical protein